jgi:DegV family protein with EDD domain
MTVKIVADSLCDLTQDIAKPLDISIVPVYVRFGKEIYRDRVEITTDEFYHRLAHGSIWPSTTQPTPNDFLEVYNRLLEETSEILVICVSSKLSGTFESAKAARDMVKKPCHIEVIDSQTVIMGLGLIVITAAKAAAAGASLDELVTQVRHNMERSLPAMSFDTLKYLAKGGRIGKAQGLLGSLLSVRPILTMRNGEVAPLTRVRSQSAALDYLYNIVASFNHIEQLAVEHATTPAIADQLINRLNALYPKERIYASTVSPVIGAYVGPHVIAVSVLGDR